MSTNPRKNIKQKMKVNAKAARKMEKTEKEKTAATKAGVPYEKKAVKVAPKKRGKLVGKK
jgi:hypothetical protein